MREADKWASILKRKEKALCIGHRKLHTSFSEESFICLCFENVPSCLFLTMQNFVIEIDTLSLLLDVALSPCWETLLNLLRLQVIFRVTRAVGEGEPIPTTVVPFCFI